MHSSGTICLRPAACVGRPRVQLGARAPAKFPPPRKTLPGALTYSPSPLQQGSDWIRGYAPTGWQGGPLGRRQRSRARSLDDLQKVRGALVVVGGKTANTYAPPEAPTRILFPPPPPPYGNPAPPLLCPPPSPCPPAQPLEACCQGRRTERSARNLGRPTTAQAAVPTGRNRHAAFRGGKGGGGWHRASVFSCLPVAAPKASRHCSF